MYLRKKGTAPVVSNSPEVRVHEYFTKADNKDINLSVVELRGEYGTNMNKVCCLIYYLLRGKMKIRIGKNTFEAEKGDSVMIPPNMPYWMQGDADFIIASAPAWYFEQYLEGLDE